MNTIGGLIEHVSGQLSDQYHGKEYIRWHRGTLVEYTNEGLKEIGTYKPEAFATTTTVVLKSGNTQSLADGALLTSISRNTDGPFVTEADAGLIKAFGAYAHCVPKLRFKNGKPVFAIRSFAVDRDNPNIFYVSPPVPSGIIASVECTQNSSAPEYKLADWDKPLEIQDKFYNNLIDFMMARAYQRDTESQVSQAQAQRLFQLFYQTMGAKYKIDAARNSGYWNGEVGTGDPRAMMQ